LTLCPKILFKSSSGVRG
jgi:hypothetical protein